MRGTNNSRRPIPDRRDNNERPAFQLPNIDRPLLPLISDTNIGATPPPADQSGKNTPPTSNSSSPFTDDHDIRSTSTTSNSSIESQGFKIRSALVDNKLEDATQQGQQAPDSSTPRAAIHIRGQLNINLQEEQPAMQSPTPVRRLDFHSEGSENEEDRPSSEFDLLLGNLRERLFIRKPLQKLHPSNSQQAFSLPVPSKLPEDPPSKIQLVTAADGGSDTDFQNTAKDRELVREKAGFQLPTSQSVYSNEALAPTPNNSPSPLLQKQDSVRTSASNPDLGQRCSNKSMDMKQQPGTPREITGINKTLLSLVAKEMGRPTGGPFYIDGPEHTELKKHRAMNLLTSPSEEKQATSSSEEKQATTPPPPSEPGLIRHQLELTGPLKMISLDGKVLWRAEG